MAGIYKFLRIAKQTVANSRAIFDKVHQVQQHLSTSAVEANEKLIASRAYHLESKHGINKGDYFNLDTLTASEVTAAGFHQIEIENEHSTASEAQWSNKIEDFGTNLETW